MAPNRVILRDVAITKRLRRLGPYAVYDPLSLDGGRMRYTGFRVDPWTPAQELVLYVEPVPLSESMGQVYRCGR